MGDVLIAPSTMPITFWKIADVPWLDKDNTFIHGRQSFIYKVPLKADSHLVCDLSLTKMEKKVGRSGELILYTHVLTCACKGEPIVTAETVLISIGDPL
nr:MaoC family dehydratase N-terminal domain-containing protein [Cohnella lupini]